MEQIEKIKELRKKLQHLDTERIKILGYLIDNEIDQAIETDNFDFIWKLLFDYFDEKDIGYILTKFEETKLKDKVNDDVDFFIDDWKKIKKELKEEEEKYI